MGRRWSVLIALFVTLFTTLSNALYVSVKNASELVHGSSATSLLHLFELKRGDIFFYPVLAALLTDDSAAVQRLYEESCANWDRKNFYDLLFWARLHLPQSSLLWNAFFSPAAMLYVPKDIWSDGIWKLINSGIPSSLSLLHSNVSVKVIKKILTKPELFPALESHCKVLHKHPRIFKDIDLVRVLHPSCLSHILTTALFITLKNQIAIVPMASLSRLILSMQGLSIKANPALQTLETALKSRICRENSTIECPVRRLNALAMKCSKDCTSSEMILQQILSRSQLSDSQLLTVVELVISKKLIPIKKVAKLLRAYKENSPIRAVGPLEVARLAEVLALVHPLAEGRAIMTVLGHDFDKILLLTSAVAFHKPVWLKKMPEGLKMAWYRRRRLHLGRQKFSTSPLFEDNLEAGYNGVGLVNHEQFLSYLRAFIENHLDAITLTKMRLVRPRLSCGDSHLLEALFGMLTLGKIRYGHVILPLDSDYCKVLTGSEEDMLRSELFQTDLYLEASQNSQDQFEENFLRRTSQSMAVQFLVMKEIYDSYSIGKWFKDHEDLCQFLRESSKHESKTDQ